MDSKRKRAVISVTIGIVIYLLFGPIIRLDLYDMYIEAIKVLTAVIGAGCYWIGSNER